MIFLRNFNTEIQDAREYEIKFEFDINQKNSHTVQCRMYLLKSQMQTLSSVFD